jgi:DNA-directed RNA polymerase specialized sigma24 family protein
MTPEEYRRAAGIAKRAIFSQRPFLSAEDWEDIQQEAALAAWMGGSVTRVWWSAHDAATKLQGGRRKVQPHVQSFDALSDSDDAALDHAGWLRAPDDVEATAVDLIALESVRDAMPPNEWVAMAGTLLGGLPWGVVSEMLGVPDGTVSRWRRRGLEKAREILVETT